ncbi:MAG TPA: ROK family protein [Saprospiraceae bacterium]|nr:ROK family protein [Saprospiraceae bacterium]
MQPPYSIGVDIGGSHITCGAVHLLEGQLLEESLARAEYHHEATAEHIFQSWASALNQTLSHIGHSQLAGIGFAIPGPFNYANGISEMQHKFPHLYGLHIPTGLQPLLHTNQVFPMRFLNDASSFAVGEAWLGEGKMFQRVVVITLGTGFGSAFTQGGIPVVSGPTVPREGCLWHLPFKESIADDYISTRWFVKEYAAHSGENISGVKELIDRADKEPFVQDLFTEFGHNLAECLSNPLKQFKAEVLIIGGNISHALPLFRTALAEGLLQQDVQVSIRRSSLMERAALLGSARLLDDAFWQKVSAELPEI